MDSTTVWYFETVLSGFSYGAEKLLLQTIVEQKERGMVAGTDFSESMVTVFQITKAGRVDDTVVLHGNLNLFT